MLVRFGEGNTAESATVFYLRETILQKRGSKQLKKLQHNGQHIKN
jgi:hypothetical protein